MKLENHAGGARVECPLELPATPYIPGITPRPSEDYFDVLKRGLDGDCSIGQLAGSAAFLGGREAFRQGYYWEAHELWEAVWMQLPPASAERHLLKGLIQLANAGLKRVMGRDAAVTRILALAQRSLEEAFLHQRSALMMLGREQISAMERQVLAQTSHSYWQ